MSLEHCQGDLCKVVRYLLAENPELQRVRVSGESEGLKGLLQGVRVKREGHRCRG